MANAPKYAQVMSVIERRVRKGDYLLRNIPGERRIAEETGVSYMTARRAVIELLNKKVLIRRDNGTLDVHPGYGKGNVNSKVVLLCPAYPSPFLAHLRQIVDDVLKQNDLTLRPEQYVHWDDPNFVDAVSNAGGTLIIPSAESIPSWTLSAMRSNRVVVLDGDFSSEGIPSIQLYPDEHLKHVFQHLHQLGHTRIDCINTQHHNPSIDRRIRFWETWLASHDCRGRLWDNPAPSFTDPTPYAYDMMSRVFNDHPPDATALVCTTFPAAIATTRVLWERGLTVGRDLSVCAMNIEHPARYSCPSITGLDMPDLTQVLARCFEWFSNNTSWSGSRLLMPEQPVFFIGESSGQVRAAEALK
jgi:DNA-binding LacI/PurR family transcriptional regulator